MHQSAGMYPRLRNLDGRGGRFRFLKYDDGDGDDEGEDSFSDEIGDVVDHLVVPPFLRMIFSRSRIKKML